MTDVKLFTQQEIFDPVPGYEEPARPRRKGRVWSKIPQERWGELKSLRDSGQSLRQLARSFGVSYETIRNTLDKIEAQCQMW